MFSILILKCTCEYIWTYKSLKNLKFKFYTNLKCNFFVFLLVTGLDLWGVLVATGLVCILYCSLVSTISFKAYSNNNFDLFFWKH